MATTAKPAPAKTATPAEPVKETPAEAPAAPAPFNWDELPEAEVPVYTRNEPKPVIDVEKDTPAAIINRIRESLAEYAPGEGMKADTLGWRTQKFPTAEIGEEFVKLARRYAKYTKTPEGGLTIRVTVAKEDPTGRTIRFAAKPREHRARLSTETAA